MRRTLIIAAAGLAIGLAAPALGPSSAWAGKETADKADKAELKECRKMADPRQKDECVRNAKSNLEKREQVETKSESGTGKAKDSQKAKADSQDKDAAIGLEGLKNKAGARDKDAAVGVEPFMKKGGKANTNK